MNNKIKTLVVVGMQWGDEGKGKITNYLAQNFDLNVRYQGGNNAGHTIVFDGNKYALQHIPASIFNPKIKNILAQGMVINPKMIIDELKALAKRGITNYQLFISNKAHVIMPYHIQLDGIFENLKGGDKIGTTKKGIGPAYQDKYARIGIRFADFINPKIFKEKLESVLKFHNTIIKAFNGNTYLVDEIFDEYSEYAKILKKYVVDTGTLIYESYKKNKSIIFEGAQGIMLCIENGTYPFVTSSSPTASGIPLYTGTNTSIINNVMGVVKAYTTRVGAGAFPSKIKDEKIAHYIREVGHEYGTVTGRPRDIGWLDTVILKYGKRVAGITEICITLLDVLDHLDTIKIAYKYKLNGKEIKSVPASNEGFSEIDVEYLEMPGWKTSIVNAKSWDDLPINAQKYIRKIEELTGLKVTLISVGPDREQTFSI